MQLKGLELCHVLSHKAPRRFSGLVASGTTMRSDADLGTDDFQANFADSVRDNRIRFEMIDESGDP